MTKLIVSTSVTH